MLFAVGMSLVARPFLLAAHRREALLSGRPEPRGGSGGGLPIGHLRRARMWLGDARRNSNEGDVGRRGSVRSIGGRGRWTHR
jgi:hypothetical protein